MSSRFVRVLVLAFALLTALPAPAFVEGNSFKQRLHTEMSQTHRSQLTYHEARRVLLGVLHLKESSQGYSIKDVYCDREVFGFQFKKGQGPGPGQIPDHNVINVEHTWPQSRFSRRESQETQKTDLHHLFPTNSEMNGIRGNYKFGEVEHSIPLKCAASEFAETNQGPRFEPPRSHKGNVARALFYFSVRYGMPIDPDEEQVLRQWHLLDPVDAEERERNNRIEQIHGNRNLFIDHPEYVDLIEDF